MIKKHLIVLASTFPRWENDKVPSFVLDFARHMVPHVAGVTAIVPHFPGAKRREKVTPDILVKRFRYAYPYRFEDLAYGQFRKTRFYPLKVAPYTASELWMTLVTCLQRRPVTINAHWIIPQGLVAVLVAPLVGAKVIISVHGADIFTLNGRYLSRVKRFVLQRADVVVANSSATQAECIKLWPERIYPIIPMGVDVEQFRRLKQKTKRSPEPYTILFVGRLVPSKGAAYLCEALRLLHEKHKDLHLKIIGDGPQRADLERYVADNKLKQVVSFLGWVQHEQLPEQYQTSDVFVGPSMEEANGWKEAFGIVFAEASAAGLPVITTNVGGMVDIIKDKETGLIVPQKDAQAICDALEHLYEHREEGKAMGAKGSEFVRENFSWDSTTQRYLRLLSA